MFYLKSSFDNDELPPLNNMLVPKTSDQIKTHYFFPLYPRYLQAIYPRYLQEVRLPQGAPRDSSTQPPGDSLSVPRQKFGSYEV